MYILIHLLGYQSPKFSSNHYELGPELLIKAYTCMKTHICTYIHLLEKIDGYTQNLIKIHFEIKVARAATTRSCIPPT